jgi:hypothetical protein
MIKMRGMKAMGWTVFCARVVVVTIASAVVLSSGVSAQTLVEPKPKLAQPSGPAKSQPALRTKACSSFGPGFAQIPGTDTCVKIGGYVTIESTVNHGR